MAIAPHTGPVLDEILIGVDEDANLAWAVELRADGMQLLRDAETAAAIAETTRTRTRNFRYLPSTTLPKIEYLPSRFGAGASTMKNEVSAEFGSSARAIESTTRICLRVWLNSPFSVRTHLSA